MEVSHSDLTEVTGVVLVKVGPVVVLTTGHTTTTGMLTVLANTTVTGRDMTAAKEMDQRQFLGFCRLGGWSPDEALACRIPRQTGRSTTGGEGKCGATHAFLVFEKRVGILSTVLSSTRELAMGGDAVLYTPGSDVEIKAPGRLECALICLP